MEKRPFGQFDHPPLPRRMALLFVMYMVQNIHTGFTWTLFPILMRSQGYGLGDIGFSVLVYSPWALKFLYASVVDRWHIPALGRRKSWFAPLMVLICLVLPLLAGLDPQTRLTEILAGVFVLNWLSATIDIAVDGYATDILRPREMAWGNTAQMTGYGVGILLGSSLFLMIYDSLGWQTALLAMAGLYAVLVLPVLLHREMAPIHSPARWGKTPPGTWTFLKTPECRWCILFLFLNIWVTHGGNQMRFPMLADKGLNAADLGRLMLFFGAPVNILGAIAGGVLITRLGESRIFLSGCGLAAVVSLWSVLVHQTAQPPAWMIAMMFGMDHLMMGLMSVMVYNLIMGISAGPWAATRFAVLCAANHMAMFTITPMAGIICSRTGYTALFMILAATSLMAAPIGRFLIRSRLKKVSGCRENAVNDRI